ncbi:Ectonucleoside triphosphate diphosphohydrolase 2 [Liparis tanakae]|uniref:Ectonucleoside triphosphate diphosphohydrolase 2 n=1 Tax=Liparis tanakae TaxID=230148 RepID=A0A4Z2EQM5_9TELE|nr:Ectonucleoside triphosphate diphosphohydrolase 2 [Liparis tanakae]
MSAGLQRGAGLSALLKGHFWGEWGSNRYGIVLDAGSSHTSVYTYRWPADKQNGTGIVTQHSDCHAEEPRAQSPEPRAPSPEPRAQSPEPRAQSPEPRAQSPEPRAESTRASLETPQSSVWKLFPFRGGGGISSYAGSPGGAARSLEVCLDAAVKDIPKYRHHQTSLYLGATAGMRLLNAVDASECQRLLEEVERKLRSYPFRFTNASILGGREEGAYGWVTVNYLLENFVKVSDSSAPCCDDRGVATQRGGGARDHEQQEEVDLQRPPLHITHSHTGGRSYLVGGATM